MARIRYIKPGLCSNEVLGVAPIAYQFVLACLPMFADREGRLEDRPLRIKANIFPYRDFDMEAALAWLHDNGFIVRYEVNKLRCIQIVTFHLHQKPHRNEPASTLPSQPMAVQSQPLAEQSQPLYVPAALGMGNGEWGMGNEKGNGAAPVLVEEFDPSQLPKQTTEGRDLLRLMRSEIAATLIWAEDVAKHPSTQNKALARYQTHGKAFLTAVGKAYKETGDRSIAQLIRAADKVLAEKPKENFAQEKYAALKDGF